MIEVIKKGILFEKTPIEFENSGVLNPGVIKEGEFVHVFYRAVSFNNYSSIGYCKLEGPATILKRNKTPLIVPEFDYESHGVEDPRIVKIDELYYLSYTAYDGINALGALAVSSDLIHWEKKGIIVPQLTYDEFNQLAPQENMLNDNKYIRYNDQHLLQSITDKQVLLWDKNLIFFPRKLNGKFYFLHRIKPDIQILVGIEKLEDLTEEFWENYFSNFKENIVLSSKFEHEISYIGGGCPPIETEDGWLLIYHGVKDSLNGYIYSACASLLDLENPQKEIGRLPYPLFEPSKIWELKGEVNNVCFPTGTALFGDTLYIYYGAADELIAYASVSLSALLIELKKNKI
ncbi:MAG: pesticidal protein Cry7Aa [Bacteroidetes bacterium B1(2017)]|nr:MAG: pesticidal protein Cry7Aa [Bacteroidetes bacterium B1(2017)]